MVDLNKTAYILLGAPGSGKGTQGNLLEKNTGFKRYVISDLIKIELKKQVKEWSKIYDVESGFLLNDGDIFELFRENFNSEKNFILDGLPRTLDQAYWLYGFLSQHKYNIKVIFLNLNENKLLERILYRGKLLGRKDDNPLIFKERLKIFDTVKKLILEIYSGEIIEVNADREIEDVQNDILKLIKRI